MIDERINKALTELESNLSNLESARKQVDKTVKSYDGLSSTTTEYVNKLGIITTNIRELVNSIGKDYSLKVEEFEKDRKSVIDASREATDKVSSAVEEFKKSLSSVQKKLMFSLVINVVSLIAIGVILFLLLR